MSLQAACQNYVESECKDGDIVLVELAEYLDSGSADDAIKLILQDEFKGVLEDLGWDVLSVLTPRLPASGDHVMWTLVQRIVEGGSPKEMCLALLEQMEALSSTGKVAAIFNMLQYLQKVLLAVSQETIVTTALGSVHRLVQLHCPQLVVGEGDNAAVERTQSCEVESEHLTVKENDNGEVSKQCQAQDGDLPVMSQSHEQEEEAESCVSTKCAVSQEGDFFSVSNKILTFMRPFVDSIHLKAIQPELLFKAKYANSAAFQEQKVKCIASLLYLLDYPLVNCNLRLRKKAELSIPTRAWGIAQRTMSLVVRCHYGCVQLLSSQAQPSDQLRVWSSVGLASFVHLLIVEELEISYLPIVLSPQLLLFLALKHIHTLLGRPETKVILKGLALLEGVTGRVQPHSICLEELENKEYNSVITALTTVMISCSSKIARQRSVSLLLDVINIFCAAGRHKLYSGLLHTVSHAGVVGLLIHSVKNEVDSALKSSSSSSESPFLGEKLSLLLKKIFTASTDMDLVEEIDKVMASLNFLRYLLIRDVEEINKTGIWSIKQHVQEKFVAPVRQALTNAKLYCRQELEAKRGGKGQMVNEGPEVTVEVSGENLPKLSDKEELQMLHLARNHMDMLESVLVRVEELLEQRT